MGSIPVWADPSGPFTDQTDRAGSVQNRTQIINAPSAMIEAAPAVTAALRWRGRCAKLYEMPRNHNLEAYLDASIGAAGIAGDPK